MSTFGASAWEFGWEALVAIGTMGLALATGFLAWTTRGVARETADVAKATQSEILADWRPVLLLEELTRDQRGSAWPGIFISGDRASIEIVNCGRGPALDVRAELAISSGDSRRAQPERVAIAAGASASFYWQAEDGETWNVDDVTAMGTLSYCDLSYTGYQTSFALTTRQTPATIDWQRVDRDPSYKPPVYGP